MKELLFDSIEINRKHVENAFWDVLDCFDSLDMPDASEDICDNIGPVYARENPFVAWIEDQSTYGKHVFARVEDKWIFLIYEEAKRLILAKFPDAKITYKACGERSYFCVDDATHQLALKKRLKDE